MAVDWSAVAARFDPAPDPYLNDPAGWVAATTGEYLWSKQLEVASALAQHRKVAVKAGHGVGKSWLAGRAVAWWLDVHPEGEAFAVTTAPTKAQVYSILWREIRVAHRKAKLPGRVSETAEWKNRNGDLIGMGRKPSDHDEDAFQGLHARYLLAVLDEACGIPRQLWDAALSLTTNDSSRLLAIGNPTNPAAYFANVCAGAPTDGTSGMSDLGWWVITISVFDSPNLTGEYVPPEVAASLTGPDYVAEGRVSWGEGSPLWVSKIEGQFPADATDGTIPWSWLQNCAANGKPAFGEVELGLDPARDGSDSAVCWARRGPAALKKWVWPYTPDPEGLAELTLRVIQETEAVSVKIDADGLGWGISGILNVWKDQGLHRCMSIPVFGSKPAVDGEHFENTRAEEWWAARERSRLLEWNLEALDDIDLQELSEPRYFTNSTGRIQLEKKAEVKKRLGKSPDSADALLLAFHVPPVLLLPEPSVSEWTDRRLKGRR